MRVSTLLRHSLGMVMVVGLMIIHRKRLAGEAGKPEKKEGAKPDPKQVFRSNQQWSPIMLASFKQDFFIHLNFKNSHFRSWAPPTIWMDGNKKGGRFRVNGLRTLSSPTAFRLVSFPLNARAIIIARKQAGIHWTCRGRPAMVPRIPSCCYPHPAYPAG